MVTTPLRACGGQIGKNCKSLLRCQQNPARTYSCKVCVTLLGACVLCGVAADRLMGLWSSVERWPQRSSPSSSRGSQLLVVSVALPSLASSCLLSLSFCSWLLQLIKCLGGVWSSLLPGGVRNSHYGAILNVKWFQMFFYLLLLAVLEEGITLTFKLALALNFYAEWADTNRDLWTLKPAFLS